jgi:HlyD family secretion protein
VNVGQTVVSNMNVSSVFLIAKDLRRMQVWASVNEADIGRIQKNMPVTFTVDAYPNEVFHGTVYQIRLNATMTQNVVTYTVVVDTANSDLRLYPYLTANLNFQVEQCTDVLKVPNGALRWKPRPQMVAPEYRAFLASVGKKTGNDRPDAAARSSGRTDSNNISAENKTPVDPKVAAAMAHATRQMSEANSKGASKDVKAQGEHKAHKGHSEHGQIWVQDGSLAKPVRVRIGATDGIDTVISGSDVKEDMEVIVGELLASQAADMSNPFAPKLFNRSGGPPKTRP